VNIYQSTRYVAVASASEFINDEWRGQDPSWNPRPPIYSDYALLKVLYMLALKATVISGVPSQIQGRGVQVHAFEYDEPLKAPLDFSGLKDSDTIFVAAHGDQNGIFAMGPDAKKGMTRLIQILTADGNLKKKRQGKSITILLLSCRAGLGLYKSLARTLYKELGINVTVGGALGFTFGSMRTLDMGLNEVLIRGIPWYIEYPNSISVSDAEKATSAVEGKTIKYADKKTEIDTFTVKKSDLEKQMKQLVGQLTSKEINAALDEMYKKFDTKWLALIRSQFEFYQRAKTESNLEFDMWYNIVADAYVWTSGIRTTDEDADAALAGDIDEALSSMK
jgi:hypothetical protein